MRGWLDDLGLAANSVHGPICESFTHGVWGRSYSNASTQAARRDEAIAETRLAFGAARRLGASSLVAAPGPAAIPGDSAGRQRPGRRPAQHRGARRGRGRHRRPAGPRGHAQRPLHAGRAARRARRSSRSTRGICLDFGHAHLEGGAPEAAEVLSGHVITTHVHDNKGQLDNHLVPVRGHDRLGGHADGDVEGGLQRPAHLRSRRSRRRRRRPRAHRSRSDPTSGDTRRLGAAVRVRLLDAGIGSLGDWVIGDTPDTSADAPITQLPNNPISQLMHAYIEDIAKFDGQSVTIKGWLAGRRSSGKIHFLQIRDGSGFIQAVMSKAAVGDDTFARADHLSQESAVVVHGTARADKRAPGGYEIDVTGLDVVERGARLPHHAQGTRRRLPDGSPPPVDPIGAPAGDPARPARSDRRRARLLQQPRVHPGRHADLHAGGVRGHDDALSRPVLRRRNGIPHAERPALQRGQRDGAWPRLLLRADVPRGEIEDAPPPHRVLDGRAGGRLRDARRRHRARRRPRRRGRRRACSNGARASSKRSSATRRRSRASRVRSRASPTTTP